MLDHALTFFKEELSHYIKIKTAGQKEDHVQFPEIQLPKELIMQNNAITLLVVNLEEERTFRSSTTTVSKRPTSNALTDGSHLDLNFHLLAIANFQDYSEGLKMLSLVLKFFRSYRLFSPQAFPALPAEIPQLSTELVNLSFMEQSELWRSLEIPCSPSALYKVRLLIFPDTDIEPSTLATAASAMQTDFSRL
ncbi:MAG: Pvc16 family protein [Cyanobacteria bacterium P01_G01_bin.54]